MEVLIWDGKTKFKMEESKEDEEKRLADWDKYLKGEEEEEEKKEGKENEEEKNEEGKENEEVRKDGHHKEEEEKMES